MRMLWLLCISILLCKGGRGPLLSCAPTTVGPVLGTSGLIPMIIQCRGSMTLSAGRRRWWWRHRGCSRRRSSGKQPCLLENFAQRRAPKHSDKREREFPKIWGAQYGPKRKISPISGPQKWDSSTFLGTPELSEHFRQLRAPPPISVQARPYVLY